MLDASGRSREAIPEFEEALEIHLNLSAADPKNDSFKLEIASDYNRLATVQAKLGDRTASLANHGRAVSMSPSSPASGRSFGERDSPRVSAVSLILADSNVRLRKRLTKMARLPVLMRSRIVRVGLLAVTLPASMNACESRRADRSAEGRAAGDSETTAPYQAEVEEGLGAAVAILVDNSGSMRDEVPGGSQAKHIVAQEALGAMLDATDAFVARRPEFPIKIGVYSFSSEVSTELPIQTYNRDVVRAALKRLPRPGGGTAIGEAMRAARPDLYRAGVFRKYLLVVTDGDNTTGRSPDDVARDIFRKSEGAVQIYFVAFDTNAEKFSFVKDVGGDVIPAGNGAELRTALDAIYQGKILAEAVDAVERR
jgi:Mg-chelatase subunit ChlD